MILSSNQIYFTFCFKEFVILFQYKINIILNGIRCSVSPILATGAGSGERGCGGGAVCDTISVDLPPSFCSSSCNVARCTDSVSDLVVYLKVK